MANIIDAIINLVENKIFDMKDINNQHNRANSIGDSLEEYVKDLFAGTFNLNEVERQEKISKTFSYLGNNSNPPDAMLKKGAAIEVKKIESDNSDIALNSSYPKHNLSVDNPSLTKYCKSAEDWEKKDMIYVVGVVKKKKLKHLTMVYGEDYCASSEIYTSMKDKLKYSIENTEGVEFSATNEFGRVNKVDPLGITYLRIRGMWGISNPWKTFKYVYERDFGKEFNFMCIINNNKWLELSNKNELLNLAEKNKILKIEDIKIKNPNNPAKLKPAKLITFWI